MGTIEPRMGTLDSLFPSTRGALLTILFRNPDRRFYLREIMRVVGKGGGSVRRELDNLVEAGIVSEETETARTYFKANKACPIFKELRGIVMKTAGLADVLAAALRPIRKRIRVAFIFGSTSRQSDRPDSDVDVAIIGDVSLRVVVRALGPQQAAMGREVNPVVFSETEFRRRVKTGEHFARALLEGERWFVVGDQDDLEAVVGKQMAE
jgi:predicted nucleotidyltransferase